MEICQQIVSEALHMDPRGEVEVRPAPVAAS